MDPQLFSLTAVIASAFVTSDFDDYELNALGNWIILFGQYLLTFASQMTFLENQIDNHNINVNSKQYKNGGSPYSNGKSNQNQRMEVEFLLDAVKKLEKELDNLKNKN